MFYDLQFIKLYRYVHVKGGKNNRKRNELRNKIE